QLPFRLFASFRLSAPLTRFRCRRIHPIERYSVPVIAANRTRPISLAVQLANMYTRARQRTIEPRPAHRERAMTILRGTLLGRGAVAAGATLLSISTGTTAFSVAKAEPQKSAGPARVADFLLADQNLFGRQLYRMAGDKAVVLVSYATGDKQLHAD